ncbi:MAG: hypothetical protein BJG00_011090 [Limnothrix sp. CACIAM 69d]|nr:MAG: hypothetical protein BJG00_011090 [Limnothrix sp. CACIAM 69d]
MGRLAWYIQRSLGLIVFSINPKIRMPSGVVLRCRSLAQANSSSDFTRAISKTLDSGLGFSNCPIG